MMSNQMRTTASAMRALRLKGDTEGNRQDRETVAAARCCVSVVLENVKEVARPFDEEVADAAPAVCLSIEVNVCPTAHANDMSIARNSKPARTAADVFGNAARKIAHAAAATVPYSAMVRRNDAMHWTEDTTHRPFILDRLLTGFGS
jgi:hypothetical protein